MQSSSPRCYSHCFPVCFRDELYCCHRKWMLDYRHGSSGSRRSCRKKNRGRKMLLNLKGLLCGAHDHVNKKQLLSLFPSLFCCCSLSIFRVRELGPQEEQVIRALPGRAGYRPSPLAPFQFRASCSGGFTPSFAGLSTGPTLSSYCSANMKRGPQFTWS